MSITTRTGDKGMTGLLFGRRVPKNHVRIDALGSVDELSAAIGLAKVIDPDESKKQFLNSVQLDLVAMMGELAIDPADRERPPPFLVLGGDAVDALDNWVKRLEGDSKSPFKKWDLSGVNESHARLHFARTVCRRAERALWRVVCEDADFRQLPGRYLNRLSDVLWLLAKDASGGAH